MPFDRSRYPHDWEQISYRIRFVRAKGTCERCGAEHGKPHPITGSTVVLTTAHVYDDDPMNVADDNLAAYCQKCHNSHDAPMRRQHAAETRRRKKIEAGQAKMELGSVDQE